MTLWDRCLPLGMMKDARPDFWKKPGNHQRVKHALLRGYLNGWLPKLGLSHGRILYIDTHAGRGEFDTGEPGSPMVALDTLLEHAHRESILGSCEARFILMEADPDNAEHLRAVATKRALPQNVAVRVFTGDSSSYLTDLMNYLDEQHSTLAPTFALVDPYSYQVPGECLRRLMSHPRVELFVNVIWREHDMARINAAQKPGSEFCTQMDAIFPGQDWRSRIDNNAPGEERLKQTVLLFAELTEAKWATYIRMLGKNRATRYTLLHLTNHDAGRDLMKECIWKACPEGGFFARAYEDPTEYLIQPTPDLRPLRTWVEDQLQSGPRRWSDLDDAVRHRIWRRPHLNSCLQDLRKEGRIHAKGRFGPRQNPLIQLTQGGES